MAVAVARSAPIRAVLAIAAIATACANASPTSLAAGGHHVLFVGNSLTYVNDLPATVAAIAAAAGDTIRVETVAGPNLALIDHLTGSTNAAATIKRGGWELVVLQQGPTATGICRDSLVIWARMFGTLIGDVHARPALFMAWPTSSAQSSFDDVRVSFQLAASVVDGVFLPAGEAWRAAFRLDPSLALYGEDGFHPSELGTFLAALEIYERISGRDARTLHPVAFASGRRINVPEATVRILQRAAHEANETYPATVGPMPQPPPSTTPLPGNHC